MPATDIIANQGGELAPLSIRIAPELKEMMASFRKETGKRPSEIVTLALTDFFAGYAPIQSVDLTEEDL